jgi:penicillin-binding protein 2
VRPAGVDLSRGSVAVTGPGVSVSRARPAHRFVLFGLVVVLVMGALLSRLYVLQIAEGGNYARLAHDNRVTFQPVRSARGLIYDRKGRQLVDNVPAFAVKVRPADLPLSRRQAVVQRLSQLLAMPTVDINEALDRSAGASFELVRVAGDIPTETARVIAEQHADLPGVEVVVEARRDYLRGPLVAHLLGFTGAVTAEDLDEVAGQGYLTDDVIGKAGVETTFEQVLRGTYGLEQVERDGQGRTLRVLQTVREAQAGGSLELTIDTEMQRDAQTALEWAMDLIGLRRGVVIVMNPQTGEILALVSLPSYDNNLFARGISTVDYQKLLKDKDRPLINFAISEQYPPGSTYKLVTGSGGLADGKITPRTRLDTRPYLTIGRYRYYEWNRQGWGPLDIYGGFGHSSDTFFFQVAGRLGIDRLAHWGGEFGFGDRTGVDLPNEARGILPTNEWKMDLFNEPIYPGEVYQAGIGQGYNAFTPIQLLNAYNALANGGRLYKPQIVRRVLSSDGRVVRDFRPELIHELDIDQRVLRTMRVAARRVLTLRHTYNLVDLPFVLAGKSGTAEFGVRDRKGRLPFHSWFATFVPRFGPGERGDVTKTDSELAVLAFAYDSRTRGNAATEIAKYFLQLHFDVKKDLRQEWLLERDNFYGT